MSNLKIYVDITPQSISDLEIDEGEVQEGIKNLSEYYDRIGHGYSVAELRDEAIREILKPIVKDDLDFDFEEKEYKD